MIKSGLVAALLMSAAPALGQTTTQPSPVPVPPPAPTPQQQAVQSAAMAYNGCLRAGAGSVPATSTPQQAADAIVAGCMTQQHALEAAANSYIATLPAAEQAEKREEVRTGLASVSGQLASAITQMRAAPPAASPAPTPAPAPHN
jgi:hypothetical protein